MRLCNRQTCGRCGPSSLFVDLDKRLVLRTLQRQVTRTNAGEIGTVEQRPQPEFLHRPSCLATEPPREAPREGMDARTSKCPPRRRHIPEQSMLRGGMLRAWRRLRYGVRKTCEMVRPERATRNRQGRRATGYAHPQSWLDLVGGPPRRAPLGSERLPPPRQS